MAITSSYVNSPLHELYLTQFLHIQNSLSDMHNYLTSCDFTSAKKRQNKINRRSSIKKKFLSSDQELLEVGLSVGRSVGLSVFQTRFQTSCPNRVSKQALHRVFPNKTQEKISCILCGNYAKLVWKPCLESRSSRRAYVPIDRGPVTVLCQVLLLSTIQASDSSGKALQSIQHQFMYA